MSLPRDCKASDLATKSVSHLISNKTPILPSWLYVKIDPWLESLPSLAFCFKIPDFLNSSIIWSSFPEEEFSTAFLISFKDSPVLSLIDLINWIWEMVVIKSLKIYLWYNVGIEN